MVPYTYNTLRGTTKPNQATWFMWALAPLVGSFVAFQSGADAWIVAPVFSSGFWPLVVFFASFLTEHGYWKLSTFDIVCGVFSFLAFVAWLITSSAPFAIALAILSDFLAGIPTVKKLWQYPETETKMTFILSFASFIVAMFAITTWNVESAAFLVYLLVMNLALMFAAYKRDIFSYFR